MAYHIFCSIPDAYDKNTVIPFRCALPEWIQRFREMLWRWSLWALIYVLGLIATHTWYRLGHCSSVAWTPYQGSSLNPQLAIWRTRLSGPFLYLAPRNGGLRWRKTIDWPVNVSFSLVVLFWNKDVTRPFASCTVGLTRRFMKIHAPCFPVQ